MVTLQEIQSAERAMAVVRRYLSHIGRELYQMRTGNALGSEYDFDSYLFETFEGSHYVGQDGPDWGVGTQIISLKYYWPRGCDIEYVTFPQSYLGEDWRALEQARLNHERMAAAEAQAREADEAVRQREEDERRTYEQLHAKYGASS